MSNKSGIKKQASQLGINLEDEKVEELKFSPPTPEDLDDEMDENLDNFTSLLDSLSTTEAKKKSLWKQIYQNALIDRRNAYVLFGDLWSIVSGDANNHALHGPNMAKYLERMSKANEQLIKLAELVDKQVQEQEEASFNEDQMYEHIKQ